MGSSEHGYPGLHCRGSFVQGPSVEAGWPLTTGSRTPPTELTPLEFRVCSSGLGTQDLHYRDNLVQDFAESRISSYATEAYSDIS